MLDTFEILTTSGVVLWSRKFNPVPASLVNNFISDVFIEEKAKARGASSSSKEDVSAATNAPYKAGQQTLKWTLAKELGLIFVAVYRSLLQLSWIDKLVDNIKTIFVSLYGSQLTKPNTTIVECPQFDEYFDQQLHELEQTDSRGVATGVGHGQAVDAAQVAEPLDDRIDPPGLHRRAGFVDESDVTPLGTPGGSRPSTPGGTAKLSRRARKQLNQKEGAGSGNEGKAKITKNAKKGRKWDADGMMVEDDGDDDVKLDYSMPAADGSTVAASSALEDTDAATWGTTTGGKFILRDLGDEVHEMLAAEAGSKKTQRAAEAKSGAATSGLVGSGVSAISSLFRNVVGGKTLTKADLDSALKGMEDHLLRKNVAREAAVRLCEGVETELLGVKTASFESVETRVRTALEASLFKMLTPTTSTDLLRSIDSTIHPPVTSLRSPRPYVISIVGVNGVGKSTNLSKIAYFLLQNKYRVLIAAGDTFRSGAVEQLAVHVRNLKELTQRQGAGEVELYQKGYGKAAAQVARDAVEWARQEKFDVVLIDTAGRRHNDARLMSDLEKFAKMAVPDRILMVGEALVGTDSVAQARNFDAAFGSDRSLDGFIISKCDTVGDMVGTLVSLVHATNVPVLFVGVGQHYSDLRNFSVRWAVEKLLGPA